ncbi:hypothetical protein DICSQDRAFT_62917 [Dichomitus squalens LYAD-421 SS1]|uniref:F-box domain-containing protein n=1 Tax=Dichomitus squalens (strain LYAD-421) TaxID=732165 RepID=R7SXB8_DICSQ|nr:uncharacterized protein DICSQDRAFT_62917 [Dichomitus squalens LYAD-421 SS1]EJF60375.1 hypothetical protein DICSQDRAFT_62917 [Dichomitus squalens LYAD-421 SS1]
MSASPRLPWEVIERIIGHSGDYWRTLCSLSLTCKQLRPYSLWLMVADVTFSRSEKIFAFRDFLCTQPQFRPFVRSISMGDPTYLAFHLRYLLPNVTQMTMLDYSIRRGSPPRVCSLPRSVLACYRTMGTRIETLRLVRLSFPNPQEFCRMLLAFTGLRTLSCKRLSARSTTCTSA